MLSLRNLLLAAGIFLATNTQAQPVIDYDAMPTPKQTIQTDLDGDSLLETVSAYALNDHFDVITIRFAEDNGDWDFDSAFIVPINLSDSDSLEAMPNGNLRIHWGCFACGRYHSQSSVVVEARNTDMQVIGYDNIYADRLFAAVITCSVNLLTGDTIVEAMDVEKLNLTTDERSYPLSALSEAPLPQVCSTAFERYDDDFMAQNYPQ